MKHRIISIDCIAQHRRVLRHFVQQTYPGIDLVEHNPVAGGKPGDDFDWSKYDLLVIDNELMDESGLDWVEEFKERPGFPAWLVLSSSSSDEATREVIRGIKLGAEDFLFKKGMQVKELYKAMNKLLLQAGYNKEEIKAPGKKKTRNVSKSKSQPAVEINVEDTQHEMQLAMAMLHGHGNWPFSMEDILAHKAYIGSYQVMSYLGHNQGATNFLGKHKDHQHPVVIRMVNQALVGDTAFMQRFEDEFSKVVQWQHPNLVRYFEYERIDDCVIAVREHIKGETMHDVMKRGVIGNERAIDYTLRMLAGLQHMHENNVLAGNFSPRDLIMRDMETPVFMEYGLMRRLHALSHLTEEISISEKPFYVSPEVVQDRTADARSEIYIAGTVFYELLAGYPPFHEGSIQDILYGHVTNPVPDLPMKEHPMNIIIKGMLMKTPSKRIQTAAEVIHFIERARG